MWKTIVDKYNVTKSKYFRRDPREKWEFVRNIGIFILTLTGIFIINLHKYSSISISNKYPTFLIFILILRCASFGPELSNLVLLCAGNHLLRYITIVLLHYLLFHRNANHKRFGFTITVWHRYSGK